MGSLRFPRGSTINSPPAARKLLGHPSYADRLVGDRDRLLNLRPARAPSIAIGASQLIANQRPFGSTAVQAREDRRRNKPRFFRDCVHVYPEHVWGDEGR